MMVTEGGTGSKTSGPSVRKIYEALFGVKYGIVRPEHAASSSAEPPQARCRSCAPTAPR